MKYIMGVFLNSAKYPSVKEFIVILFIAKEYRDSMALVDSSHVFPLCIIGHIHFL